MNTPNKLIKIARNLIHQKAYISIGLDSQSNKNALSKELIDDLNYSLQFVKEDNNAHAVVFHSLVDKIFCAGADLKQRLSYTTQQTEDFVITLRNTFQNIYNIEIPTISVCDGFALGGGYELMLATDMRIISESSVLGLPETGLAIIPGAGGTQRLRNLIGESRAKELIFLGSRVKSQQALNWGLVNYVEKDGMQSLKKAEEIIENIMTKGPVGIRAAKKAIQTGNYLTIQDSLEVEKQCYKMVLNTEDRIEGLKSFVEKRSPIYQNK